MNRRGFLCLSFCSRLAFADATAQPVATPTKAAAEAALLNLPLGPHLQKLLIWDDPQAVWRLPRPDEAPSAKAPVLVLHFWADYCKPCLRELPVFRDMAEQMEMAHAGKVRFVYLTLTATPADMRAFMLKHQAILPKGAQFSDVSLQAELERHLREPLALPATFVLDERRHVRLAILGSVAHRRTQLGRAITQLLGSTAQPSSRP